MNIKVLYLRNTSPLKIRANTAMAGQVLQRIAALLNGHIDSSLKQPEEGRPLHWSSHRWQEVNAPRLHSQKEMRKLSDTKRTE
jgi:hypothetical protein